MNELHNTIALENKQSIVLNRSGGAISKNDILVLMADIAQLGYTLNAPAISVLETQTDEEFVIFRKHLVKTLKVMVGANVKHRPLFKKFPADIPDDGEYFMKRIVGFFTNMFDITEEDAVVLSCGHAIDTRLFNLDDFGACPICQHQVDELDGEDTNRIPLEDITPAKIIGLATVEDVYQIFSNLLAAKASISDSNKAVISELVEHDQEVLAYIPIMIPMKENLALIAGLVIQHTNVAVESMKQHFKTATDVLRLAVQLSGGDVSLAVKSKFKMTNKERKVIMGLLDNVSDPEADMIRHRMRWVRLGHYLHIGSHQKRFPNAFKAIDTMRNNASSVATFGGTVEALLHDMRPDDIENQRELISRLAMRPGDFARRLDHLLRTVKNTAWVTDALTAAAPKLTTPMLMALSAHFKNRSEKSEFRYFIPKGKVAKIQTIEDTRETIAFETIGSIMNIIGWELHNRFVKLDGLGDVLLDPALKNYVLPMQQRSASKSLVTVPRGSRIEIPEAPTLRMFLYWKNGEDNYANDVDLSAVAYTEDMEYVNHLSYTNMKIEFGVHSGDIQNAPMGASEFVDINVEKALAKGVRYISMNVISYSGQAFDSFESFAGVMGRTKSNSGQPYEPKTVEHKFDIGGDTRMNIPLLFDLKTREILWMDIALTTSRYGNVENMSESSLLMVKAINTMLDTKPTMFDLFDLHARARATSVDYERVEDKEYDLVLDASKATELDDILANWM